MCGEPPAPLLTAKCTFVLTLEVAVQVTVYRVHDVELEMPSEPLLPPDASWPRYAVSDAPVSDARSNRALYVCPDWYVCPDRSSHVPLLVADAVTLSRPRPD